MSLRFDRVNEQYIDVGDTSTFKWLHGAENPSAFKLSVSFWMKLVNPGLNAAQAIVSNNHLSSEGIGFGIYYDNRVGVTRRLGVCITRGVAGQPVIYFFSSDGVYPNDTNWHNVIVTYNQSLAANNLLLYVDGTLVGQGTKTANAPVTSNASYPMEFGRDNVYVAEHIELDGYLEDLRFYKDYVLSADEVKVIARTRGHDGIVNNLFARYEFRDGYDGEPTGKTVLLLHGDGSEGSKAIKDYAYGNKAVTVYGNAQVIEGVNKFGGSAIKFDGNGSYISLADSDDWWFDTQDFTIDFWYRVFKLPPYGSEHNFIYSQYVDESNYIQFFVQNYDVYNGSGWMMQMKVGGTAYYAVTGDGSVKEHTWYHVALVRQGTSVSIYQDGVKLPYKAYNGVPSSMPNYASPIKIGGLNHPTTARYGEHYIDEFRITKGSARWVRDFTPPHQEYFSEIADTSGKGLYTFVSSASAPRYRGGELTTQRRYRRW